MRVVTEVSKVTIVNGPGAMAMLDALIELSQDRMTHGSNFKSRTFLDFTAKHPYAEDVYKIRIRVDTLSLHKDRGSVFRYYLCGSIGGVLVEIIYIPDRRQPIRGEVSDL